MDLTVDISGICGVNEWHVTIDALLRRFGVIEGQRALMGDTAFLPLIIVVEAAYPSEVVDRFVEMHFMAG